MRLYHRDIEYLIKEPYLSRGMDYFNKGKVQIISVNESESKSKVVGSTVYRVTLWYEGPLLGGECSCPAFMYYGPCKHMAATGFALIYLNRKKYRSSVRSEHADKQVCLKRLKKQIRSLFQ
ncbi:MAG: SWIM zinc finger family protein [Wolbachia endosymbiont of Melophagus ovinus]|nr:SWIM zinc finger family protein [Wolbachia endosymbiont of Melophagus ovinus]